jgi:hypothetical protein
MLYALFQWLHNTETFTALRESALAYPIIMTLHLVGMAVFGGMILMTDMRLLGWGMRNHTISEVIEQLRPWKWFGFALTVTCGFLIMASKAEVYYHNPYYWTKMILLGLVGVHALVFRPGVYKNTAALDQSPVIPAQAKVAAVISLVLWLGVVSAGRWIGYWEPPEDERAKTQQQK